MKSIQENSEKSPPSFTSPAQPALNRSQGAYSAFRFGDFRLLLIGLFIASLGEQMINVAIGWELYERTGSALVLGGVGLVMVIPIMLLSLPAGHLTDRFNRKAIVIVSQVLSALGCVGLTVLSYTAGSLVLIYGCLLLIGVAVAFSSPATSTLLPQTVPEDVFQNAATWSSSASQLASVVGPALGGFVIAISGRATPVYAINAGVALVFAVLIVPLRGRQRAIPLSEQTTLASLLEGMRFLRGTQVILAAITLDMFAVLLGGATTLLPIYAKDILRVGPVGLGWLRAAPSVGALSMSICIAHAPSFKKAGRTLLWAVAGFGAATIVFGISHSFWLSLLMLLIMGGLDNISVVIRHTLVLMRTPDAMLGRISSVNSLFIAISNELGGFESGLAAQLFGPIIAVAGGGVGTILVVLCVALLWPEMRRLRTLGEPKVEDSGRLI
ncbi:MAG TPA: MFS transporter [Ktedonobacteraceae bacterium]|nr:MFS transporter [Ktedonobacteraceae bacterium]